MSDTDDTDDLLLIPPDFFTVHSDTEDSTKPYGPYYKVVDNLIIQVNKLEDRINHIETTSDSSLLSNSIDAPLNTHNNLMSGIRKFNSLETLSPEIYIGSTSSTPQKPKTKLNLNSLPATPTARYIPSRRHLVHAHNVQSNVSNIPSSPIRNKLPTRIYNKNLDKIDAFISNIKTIQKFQAAKNLNSQFDYASGERYKLPENLDFNRSINLKHADQVINSIDPNREKEIEIKEKRGKLVDFKDTFKKQRNKSTDPEQNINHSENLYSEQPINVEKYIYKKKAWKEGETKSSVPDRGLGMRDMLYNDHSKNADSYNTQKLDDRSYEMLTVTSLAATKDSSPSDLSAQNTESIYSENSHSLSSSDSTQLTAYQNSNSQNNISNHDSDKIHSNAMHVLNIHQKLLSRNSIKNPQTADNIPIHNKQDVYPNDMFENRISNHEPSKNTLALLRLSELWNHQPTVEDTHRHDATKYFNKLQEEKLRRQHCEQLIQQLQMRTLELQERLAVAIQVDEAKDEAILNVHKSWEEAVAKIDSLNSNKVNLEQIVCELKNKHIFEASEAEKKASHYESEASKALDLAHSAQEKFVNLEKQNQQLINEIQSWENKFKDLEINYSIEVENTQQLTKTLSEKEIELNENRNILSDARKEVAQSKRAVEICQSELNSMKLTQNQVEMQLNQERDRIKEFEKEKMKMINDIEGHKKFEKTLQDDLNRQKDILEQNKLDLRNFYQNQVEIVVKDKLREFQAQLEKAENSLQGELKNRELSVAKAAALHIQQITEKHALEIHLLEEKHKEEVKLYILQLSKAHQQIEAFNFKLQQQQDRKTYIAQQLHKVMEAQWLEALKIINSKSPIVSEDKSTNTLDQLNSLKSKSHSNVEEILFKDEVKGKQSGEYKNPKFYIGRFPSPETMSSMNEGDLNTKFTSPAETPVTSRPQKTRQQLDHDIQRYVQMLLNRSPGNPTDQNAKHDKLDNQTEISTLNNQWQQFNDADKINDAFKTSKTGFRDRSNKPPWK